MIIRVKASEPIPEGMRYVTVALNGGVRPATEGAIEMQYVRVRMVRVDNDEITKQYPSVAQGEDVPIEIPDQEMPSLDLKDSIDYLTHEYRLNRPVKDWGYGSPVHHMSSVVEAVKKHMPAKAYGETPITKYHKQAVKDRDAALFALRDLVRAVDEDVKAGHVKPATDGDGSALMRALKAGRALVNTIEMSQAQEEGTTGEPR